MIAYYFRFVDEEGPTGWCGFALAKDAGEMLWQIDEHGDPYACQIKTTSSFSWCAVWDNEAQAFNDHEICQSAPTPDEDGWRDPPWVNRMKEEQRGARRRPEKFGFDKLAPF